MATTIDSRVVEAKFDGNQFQSGVASTMSALEKLKNGLQMRGAAKGLEDVSKSAQNVPRSFAGFGSAISGVASQFSALQTIATGALLTIGNKVAQTASQMAKSFTTAPVTGGYHEYETKLQSIQTILANTQASGATLKDVSGALQELNTYSDQTIYNFGEMAKNIGTFTAAGVDLQTATGSIKGIANLAALSGSSSQQASGAMYQLSQAISAGKVSLMDWNSVVNAGMGGTVFQRALAQTAVAMDKLPAGAVKLDGAMKNVKINGASFRDSIDASKGPSWLTSDVLTNTLQQFTGDLSDAELAAQGFNTSQIAAIKATAATAKNAATIVKTGSQLMGTLKESAESGWATSWELIIGDFEEAKTLWTGVNSAFGGIIQGSANARNKVLQDWKDVGGRDIMIQGFKNAFTALSNIIKPVSAAFRQIFPAKTGMDLLRLTQAFSRFTGSLIIGGETAEKIKRTFAGVFAVFSILGQIIGGAIRFIASFFGSVQNGAGSFLNATASVGDFLVKIDSMMKKSGVVKTFFESLRTPINFVLDILGKLGGVLAGLFDNVATGGADKLSSAFGAISDKLSPLQKVGAFLQNMFASLGGYISTAAGKIREAMSSVGDAIGGVFENANFGKALTALNTGLFAGILILIKNFLSGFSVNLVGGGVFDKFGEAMDGVTNHLKAMTLAVKADALLKIAIAVAVLAGSLVLLAMVDSEKLAGALAIMVAGMGSMAAMLQFLSTSITTMGAVKTAGVSASLLLLSGALLIMAVALKIMATMSWEEIGKGLLGLGGSLAIIAAALRLIPTTLVAQATAILVLAVALSALAIAVKLFASMSLEEMARGLGGIAASMVVLAAGLRLIPVTLVAQAFAIGVLAASLIVLAGAVRLFASMSIEQLATGLGAIAASLVILAIGLRLIPVTLVAQAAALVLVAGALNLIASAVMLMSTMSMDEIGRGLLVLGGSLLILAGGLNMMIGALPGAAALLVATGALMLLTPVLITLGSLSWGTIVTGLLTIAGVFAVLGIAGLLLTPVIPMIMGLAVSMALIGGGLMLAGAGVAAFAGGLKVLVSLGGQVISVVQNMLLVFVQSIPKVLSALGQGIVNIVVIIGNSGAAIARAFGQILGAVLTVVTQNIPKIGALFGTLMGTLLKVVTQNIPKVGQLFMTLLRTALAILVGGIPMIAAAGLRIIISLISIMAANIGRVVTVATTFIVNFLNGIAANMPRITAAGINLVHAFISSVIMALAAGSGGVSSGAAGIGRAIINGIKNAISGGIGAVTSAAKGLAHSALNAAKSALGIHSPSREFVKVGEAVVEGFGKGMKRDQGAIQAAYKLVHDTLVTARAAADEDIKDLNEKRKKIDADRLAAARAHADKLARLNSAKKKDPRAIAAENASYTASTKKHTAALLANQQAMAQARKERVATNNALVLHDQKLAVERNKLESLGIQYERYTEQIKDADKALEDSIKTRDDYAKSITDQLSNLPDVSKDTKLTKYMEELQKKVVDTRDFSTAIQKLRSLGLNDAMYKELLAKGPESMPFIAQLLDSGKGGVDALNTLGTQLDTASKTLGTTAAKSLYQAGVDSAQGLVDGLKAKQGDIAKQMDIIAGAMVAALKKKLGIKSPSKEFAKLGGYSVEGLAKGLKDTSAVTKAVDVVGNDAMNALRLSMAGLYDAISGEMDLNPVITPVLDLTNVKKGAQQLSMQSISVDSAYSKAKDASKGYNQNREMFSETEAPVVSQNNFSYVQNNMSPKALSEATIYRQTKNQLSTVKGGLKT